MHRSGDQRLYHESLHVADEDHYVRQLEHGVAPDLLAGRDPGEDRALGGPDKRTAVRCIGVLLQVEGEHETVSCAARCRTLNEYRALPVCVEDPRVHVVLHRLLYAGDALLPVVVLEIALGEYQVVGGRVVRRHQLDGLPVVLLAGELVAGDDGPSAVVDFLLRKKYVAHVHSETLHSASDRAVHIRLLMCCIVLYFHVNPHMWHPQGKPSCHIA